METTQMAPGDHLRSVTVGERKRTYILHVPPQSEKGKPLPLVFVFHGGGGNAEHAVRMTGMSAKADKEGFLVVYPNGSGRQVDRLLTWNAGHGSGYAFQHKVDDVGFFRALLETVQHEVNVDPRRIYVAGMSNGGMMTYRLGIEIADKLAAIACVSGSLGLSAPTPRSPLSVIIFHGTADQNVLYAGGRPTKTFDIADRIDRSVADTVAFWVQHNGCDKTPERAKTGLIQREAYAHGKRGAEVILYTIEGGGHAWPGGERGSTLGDEPTKEISATDLIWDFFKSHPKKKSKGDSTEK